MMEPLTLRIVDDATHEAVSVLLECGIADDQLVRMPEEVYAIRGWSSIIRVDNGK